MNNHVYEEQYRGYTIKVYQDECPVDPRTWDNLGHMVCFHRRYVLGDQDHGLKPAMFANWGEVEAHLVRAQGAVLITPLYLLDHSGLYLRAGRGFRDCDPQGWDSGQVGIAYVTRRAIVREYGADTPRTRKKARRVLQAEIEVYTQYIQGDVWGYTVKDPQGELIDSCWGFYGPIDVEHSLMEYVHNAIDCHIKHEIKNHARKVKLWIRNRVPMCYRTPTPLPYGV